jgi:hypothetical protein
MSEGTFDDELRRLERLMEQVEEAEEAQEAEWSKEGRCASHPLEGGQASAGLPQDVSLRSLLVRIRSSSGYSHALRTAARRLLVAALAVARGYLDQERALTTALARENELLSARVRQLEEELALLRSTQTELLALGQQAVELLEALRRGAPGATPGEEGAPKG